MNLIHYIINKDEKNPLVGTIDCIILGFIYILTYVLTYFTSDKNTKTLINITNSVVACVLISCLKNLREFI